MKPIQLLVGEWRIEVSSEDQKQETPWSGRTQGLAVSRIYQERITACSSSPKEGKKLPRAA